MNLTVGFGVPPKKQILSLAFFWIALSFGQPSQTTIDTLVSYVEGISYPEFSGVVLLANNDSILYHRAMGYANKEDKLKNSTGTLFNIASITKTFTAVGILQLVDAGKLDLHEPIGAYLPDYPNKEVREQVTAHHLLTHTAGLNNFLVGRFKDAPKEHLVQTSDYLPFFVSEPLLFVPGSDYAYSAAGYMVLGLLLEQLSGKTYHRYVKEHITTVAAMENTLAIPLDTVVGNKARGYTTFFGTETEGMGNEKYLSMGNPAGFYYATALDIHNFQRALEGQLLMSKTQITKMKKAWTKGYYTHYGYGLSIDQRFSEVIIGHTGGWYGVQCELMHFEDSEITVVLLSNVDTAETAGMTRIANHIKHLVVGKPLTTD